MNNLFTGNFGNKIFLMSVVSGVLAVPSLLLLGLSFFPRPLLSLYSDFGLILWIASPLLLLLVGFVLKRAIKNKRLVLMSFLCILLLQFFLNVSFFIPASPRVEGWVICNSEDPAIILVKAAQVNNTSRQLDGSLGKIVIINLTGGKLSNVTCKGTGAFNTIVPGCPSQSVEFGQEIELNPKPGEPKTYLISTIQIGYNLSTSTEQRTTAITCSGPITIT